MNAVEDKRVCFRMEAILKNVSDYRDVVGRAEQELEPKNILRANRAVRVCYRYKKSPIHF